MNWKTKTKRQLFTSRVQSRAVAIVCTAIVENRLTDLIAAAMRPDADVFRELFRPVGPVGSLASKIRLTYPAWHYVASQSPSEEN
jgi:hypothetical protein